MKRRNSGQVIIITLWVMIILALLAISVANRVAIALRLARYQRDCLKADALALAGINSMIFEFSGKKNIYGLSRESWVDNKEKFYKVVLDPNKLNETFTVSYEALDENGQSQIYYGALDEERKVNINNVDVGLLAALFEELDISAQDSQSLADNICAWRGENASTEEDSQSYYADKGYSRKGMPFTNIQELLLVKDMSAGTYAKIKDFITVFGTEGKININTANAKVLRALIRCYINKLISEASPVVTGVSDGESLLAGIIAYRNKGGCFSDIDNLATDLNFSANSKEGQILNLMRNMLTTQSWYFRIRASGELKNYSLIRHTECVFDNSGDPGKIVFWHQD